MYALINSMSAIDGQSLGRVLSLHRRLDTARKADRQLQRCMGDNNYLPTVIVRLVRPVKSGMMIENDEWVALDIDEMEECR